MPSVHSKKRSHGDESDISDKSTEVSQLKKKNTDNTESVGADHHLKKRSKALEEDDDEETKGSKAHKKGLKIPSDTAEDEQAAKQKKAQDIYENIPVKVTGKKISPIESFADCNLVPQIMNSINTAGYTKPTPVQKYALPIILEGDDLMASAQTGSGKTAAFLVPFIQKFLLNKKLPQTFRLPDARGWRRDGIEMPLALILAPTRELALQINQEAQKFVRGTLIKSAVVYGGASYVEQCKQMERGCHIVIATPGRLQDFVDRGKLSLEQIQFLCLDEADRMLDMGFEPQIRSIVEGANMPPRKNRQTVMFSATFPKAIQKLAADFLRDDNVLLEVGRSGSTTELITQVVKFMQEDEKMAALLETLTTKDAGLTLVFVNQKRTADTIARNLSKSKLSAVAIHGDRSQHEREDALSRFKTGRTNILVATSVAARGLDIYNVKHVINYDLPDDFDDYVHRIGRTGRAGTNGLATAFFTNKNKKIARELVKLMQESKQEVPDWLNSFGQQRSSGGGGFGGRRPWGGGRGGRGGGRGGFRSGGGGGGRGRW